MDPYQASKETEKICRLAPVIPVLVVHEPGIAKPLAEALIAAVSYTHLTLPTIYSV